MSATTTISSQVVFQVARWSYWTADAGAPEVPEVPVMLRRRASRADKAALRVAFDCVEPERPTPAVFCSRRGEMHRSVELLEQLAQGEGLSPTSFSLSVHNSAAALYSIARGDRSPMSALAAGKDTLPQGLLEAASLLADGAPQVLLVAYDDQLPAPLAPYRDEDDTPAALGMLLSRSEGVRYSLELSAGEEQPGNLKHQMALVAEFLQRAQPELEIASAPRRWIWRRHA